MFHAVVCVIWLWLSWKKGFINPNFIQQLVQKSLYASHLCDENAPKQSYASDFVNERLQCRKSSPSEYFRGKQTGTFRVTKGGPLPFAVDIVAPTLKYGFKCFMKYPADIPDYFKQAFPEGLTYDRKLTFEDGGSATATVEMR